MIPSPFSLSYSNHGRLSTLVLGSAAGVVVDSSPAPSPPPNRAPELPRPAMGKAARWFRNILGGKKDQQSAKDHQKQPREKHQADQLQPPPTNGNKRWSFGKSSRDSAEAHAVEAAGSNAAIARAAQAAWLKCSAETTDDREREQSTHAIAVAAATAAAADAAVAAAQAAVAVVRLTSKGRAAGVGGGRAPAAAAVRIQTAFRGFLAKKALRALKALVKLQALVRGYLVRRQAAAALQSMQALFRAQAAVRAHRAGAAALPHLHHHQHPPPLVRPRYSLQERYVADDTRSEHGGLLPPACSSRRMSASVVDSSSHGYDRSPKIVEVDPGRPRSRSSSSRRAASSSPLDEDWSASANSVSSPLPCYHHHPAAAAGPPPRIAVRQFPDYVDWCALEKARPATAQSTPRMYAPPTPTKSVAGGGGYCSPASSLLGCPGYMSSTQSSEAKARSQSAPKQRPAELARKRVPLSEVVVTTESSRASVGTLHRSSCTGCRSQETFSFKSAVVGRMDRTLEVAGGENDRLMAFLQRRW